MHKRVIFITVVITTITVVVIGGVCLLIFGWFALKTSDKPLNCHVCHGTKNFGKQYEDADLRYFYKHSALENKTEIPVTSVKECLHDPKYTMECEKGEYCGVHYMKKYDVERVDRKCFKGGKLGCNRQVVIGIPESACFCAEDKCKQVPKLPDFPIDEERIRRFEEQLFPRRIWRPRKHRKHF